MTDTLLLADDSVTMQRVIELTLAREGLEVVSVSDGQQAIDHITARRPALALVSVSLPKVNGFDVARYVRDHRECGVPVLLLAGAFDTIDDAQVRATGAAGVLVKPFEPSVVIKRVKELLGMKSGGAAATAEPPGGSGRLVTSSDGVPPESVSNDGSEAPGAVSTAAAARRTALDAPGAHDVAGQPVDYQDQLNAVFDSLDAQLAAHSGLRGRGTIAPPSPHTQNAADVTTLSPAASITASSAEPIASTNPVFEVDANWFDQKPSSEATHSEEFVVTRASDFLAAPPSTPDDRSWIPATAREATESIATPAYGEAPPANGEALSATTGEATLDSNREATDDMSPLTHDPMQALDSSISQTPLYSSGMDSSERSSDTIETGALDEPPASQEHVDANVMALPQPQRNYGASYGAPLDGVHVGNFGRSVTQASVSSDAAAPSITFGAPPPAAPLGAADAFAMLWAQEQGEALPTPPPPTPVDLGAETIEQLTGQLSERVSERIVASLSERLVGELSARLTGGLADRLTAAMTTAVTTGVADRVANRLSTELAGRLADILAPRLTEELAGRIEPLIVERLAASVSDRLAPNFSERVAEILSERTLQGTLGDSLRKTVNEVAERVVRAEIERIRAAAAQRTQ